MKKLSIVLVLFLMFGCSSPSKDKEDTSKKDQKEEKQAKVDEQYEVSFSAVGDNLIHEAIYYYNRNSDGTYNFDYMYENTNYLTKDADISYINLETLVAGESLGLSGYPTFNGPSQILDALSNAGFTWLNVASNHSYDRGEEGVLTELDKLSQFPNIVSTGMHASEMDAQQAKVIEKNGMKIGILGYTYGLNGFVLPEGKEYLIDLIDKDKMKNDIETLKKVSDIQVVSMHWGEEYQFEPNDYQLDLAQFLSDEGVDVIIGAHPHVIQPVDYLKGVNGNDTLVIYSLGNFISAQSDNFKMLGGMARFHVVYNKTKDLVSFKDVEFLPTVTLIQDNFHVYHTYALKDYTDEMASQHTLHVTEGQDVSRQYFIDLVESVMNDKVKIVY